MIENLLIIGFIISVLVYFRLLFLQYNQLVMVQKSLILLKDGLQIMKRLIIEEEKKIWGNSVSEQMDKERGEN